MHVSVIDVSEAMFAMCNICHITNELLHGTLYSYPGIYDSLLEYPYWAAAVIGPFLYISAVAHAALWRQISSIVDSVVSFHMW